MRQGGQWIDSDPGVIGRGVRQEFPISALLFSIYAEAMMRPYLKKDIEKIEKVQRRATKMISECSKLSYEDRLKITGLSTLEDRRNRGDLIEVFKILRGFSKVDYRHYFQLVNSSKTRGNKYKLVKSRSRLDIRKHFFSQR